MSRIDDISPGYVGEDRLDVRLDSSETGARAFASTLFVVDYGRAAPDGVVLPLVLEVQGPSAESYQRRVFDRSAPTRFVVTFREGGRHLVLLREAAHNRWHGKLRVFVEGDSLLRPGD